MKPSSTNLTEFIEHARKKGMDHQTIRILLLSAGWKEKDIVQAMSKEALEMPVPVPPDAGGARDAFFHLLMFVSLFTTAISSVTLLFQYINRWLPDAAFEDYYSYDDGSGVRWGMAALLVSFPLFLWISRIVHSEIAQHPEKAGSGIRRWLTYITLFVAASTLMGDAITLVFYLLNGELSLRFILKVLVILYVAGSGFYYFYRGMKLTPGSKEWKAHNGLFRILSIISVLLVFALGFLIAGSPQSERMRRLDEQRINDLRTIQQEIRNITLDMSSASTVQRLPLPADLKTVQQQAVYAQPDIADPVSGTPYTYTVKSESMYELCAVFDTTRDQEFDIFWNHPAGEHCFNIDVMDIQR